MRDRIYKKVMYNELRSFLKIIPFLIMTFIAQILLVSAVLAQEPDQINITGKVTDNNGETMIGVNIIIKNTSNSVS